jgi:5'-nucleotidase/UDP-sugar diphosphatase
MKYYQFKVKMKIKRSVYIFLLALLFVGPEAHSANTASVKVTILFFNDIHGHLKPYNIRTEKGRKEVGGIARLATLIKNIETENKVNHVKTFVLVAGDMLQGTPMSTIFKGVPDIKCFNVMGVDAMTVGNHEFDFGLDNFERLKKSANFPFLSANIVYKKTEEQLAESFISLKITQNIELTVIGVTTRELLITTNPLNVEALKVLDPVPCVNGVFNDVKQKGPVILLSHCRHKTDRKIAEAVQELTAIIGGHDQILLAPFRTVEGVPVFQAFEKGRYLGRIDLAINPSTKKAVLISNDYIEITPGIKTDPKINKIVKHYDAQLDEEFKEVIGNSETYLDGERFYIRYEETTLGNFVTDIMRKHTGAGIALLNAGSLRASIDTGPITVEDVFKAMPYANEIVIVEMTGREILRVLSRSVIGNRDDEDGGFLHVSGIKIRIKDHRIEKVELDEGRGPIEPDTIYKVAITDFLASGGDGYSFTTKRSLATGLPLRELIVDDIRSKGTVSAKIDGRIVRDR